MTPEEWATLKRVLQEALERPSSERAAFLDLACAGDANLRREADEHLRLEADAAQFFDVTGRMRVQGAVTAADGDTAPARIGAYRIVRRLGEGGMGIVYLGERDDGAYSQQVALKVMKPEGDGGRLLALFRQERQILAGLQHPNITRLYDGGETVDGRLYLVMEFVEGVAVTEYCRLNSVPLRRRLELFNRICEAVSHAHRNLVIHRDLKPGNILVTADGNPKLLDFGLAKVFQAEAGASGAASTATILTPGYASPEQVRGERLTTATDVYSLGVLLFEMLTGASPYEIEERSALATYRAICEQEVKPPSGAVAGGLERDLDDITLMALRKEPELRYASVDDLRQDVERHLQGEPVRASRGRAAYRVGKFVRRNRWGVTAGMAACVGAAVAVFAIWWQGQQAELRFQQVRRLAHSVVYELHDAIRDLPGSTAARKLLVERALEYLKELESTGGKNRELQLELAGAYDRIGQVQAGRFRANLGDTAGSLDSHTRARRILKALLQTRPRDEEAERLLADTDRNLSDYYETAGDTAAWRDVRREVTELQRSAAARHPDQPALRARALWDEAYTLSAERQEKAAIPVWKQAIEAFRQGIAKHPEDQAVRSGLARSYSNLARCYQETGRKPEALLQYREAMMAHEALLQADPRNTRTKMELSWDLLEIGWLEHEADHDREAVSLFERALGLQQQLAAEDPNDARARMEVAKLMITMAVAYDGAGLPQKAAASLREAGSRVEGELHRDPANTDARIHLAWAYTNLGDHYWKRASRTDAGAAYRRALAALDGLRGNEGFGGLLDPRKMRAHVTGRLSGEGS